MNLHDLNADQQVSFLTIAHKIAIIDGHVLPEENLLIQHVSTTFGGHVKVVAQDVYGESNTEHFTTHDERMFLIHWMYLIALSDGHFHPHEISVVKEVLGNFNFTQNMADTIQVEAQAIWESEYAHRLTTPAV